MRLTYNMLVAFAILMPGAARAQDWFDRLTEPVVGEPKPAPGPHTLVISDGQGMTRIDYKSGASCLMARDKVRRQVAPPQSTPGIIYARSRTTAFCVPR